ncbi:MAG TPA: hypothetical protein ENN75_03210 [candidate division Zixibacteria bacterium]|nr:hypothetical protein [candidate division Zixibacteria bacterium]
MILPRNIIFITLIFALSLSAEWQAHEIPEGVYCDADSDCFLLPDAPLAEPVPALIYLSCTGGKPWDIDSVRAVHDELGWAIATCGKSRNHRTGELNEADILRLQAKLEKTGQVNKNRIYLFGFSGQGAQALGTALRHPKCFDGAVIDCAHTGNISHFDPQASAHQAFYIITKTGDWNREHNEKLHKLFVYSGIRDTLIIGEGEHGIGPATDVLRGCLWFDKVHRK